MRRLLPFTELVAKVERLAGGAPALPASRSAARVEVPARAASRPTPAGRPPAAAPSAPATRSAPSRLDDPARSEPPAPAVEATAPTDPAGALLVKIRGLCETRPTLAQPLRGAEARLEGKTLTLTVSPAFVTMASTHTDEYRDLARKATGRTLTVEFEAGAATEEPETAPSDEELRRQRLRAEAEKEPAVQEALDLFDGRVVDVREAKPPREDA
jgi:hypothetical protein